MMRRLFGSASSSAGQPHVNSSGSEQGGNDGASETQVAENENEVITNYIPNIQRVSGSLFEIIETADGTPEQKCIYIMCECFVRPSTERFTFELVIVRTDADETEEEEEGKEKIPKDMIITIEKSTGFQNVSNQFTFFDYSGKKYSLDIDDENSCNQLKDSISISLYQKLYSSLPTTEEEKNEVAQILTKKLEVTNEDLLVSRGELLRVSCELLKLDLDSPDGAYLPVLPLVIITINSAIIDDETKSRVYVMAVYLPQSGSLVFEIEINNSLNAQFLSNDISFLWFMAMSKDVDVEEAFRSGDTSALNAFTIKFADDESYVQFRNQFTLCLFEVNNNASINDLKLKAEDISYIQNSSTVDDPMEIEEEENREDEEERQEEEEKEKEEYIPERSRRVQDARHRASLGEPGDGLQNSHLAIANNHDRTFVVRGNKMGVFHTGDDGAQWKTTIDFKTNGPGGRSTSFTPSKVLLHRQDDSMLLLDPTDKSKIMRMDLNTGSVVDTWDGQLTANTPIKTVHQSSKYANMTDQQDFIGLNSNQLLRMDPRTKQFLVQTKKYAAGTRARLNCVATTGSGYLTAASENGDIRLFDQIGKNAKTHLPGLGDEILGIDVTEDGQFILATTEKYLLLIDTNVKGQAKNGFEKSMGKNKPKPRKLTIRNDDIMRHKMGKIKFTTAHFNTGPSMERSIVTSTGPFIIVWNFRQLKMGKTDAYTIKRYQDTVVDDNFPYDNDGRIVVTLPNDVSVAKR